MSKFGNDVKTKVSCRRWSGIGFSGFSEVSLLPDGEVETRLCEMIALDGFGSLEKFDGFDARNLSKTSVRRLGAFASTELRSVVSSGNLSKFSDCLDFMNAQREFASSCLSWSDTAESLRLAIAQSQVDMAVALIPFSFGQHSALKNEALRLALISGNKDVSCALLPLSCPYETRETLLECGERDAVSMLDELGGFRRSLFGLGKRWWYENCLPKNVV